MENIMRGMGRIYQPSWKDKRTGQERRSPTFWISYSIRGKIVRESSHSVKESDARRLLKKRLGDAANGKPVGPDVEKTTFEDLASMIVSDYKANGRTSTHKLEDCLTHLHAFFGDYRAIEITGDRVTAYIAQRQDEKAAASTVNNELAALSRMFVLAIRAGRAAGKPYIQKLQLNNARKGFFEHDQFVSVLRHLPEHLQPMLETAYITGWRIHSEILTRQKHHLDLQAGWLRLDPGETKNREGRMFPLTPKLREILSQQMERTRALEKETGRVIPWLFHCNGKPIKSFRRAWITACVDAGFGHVIRNMNGKVIKKVADRIPHDFRRTAVRNLERAGVPRSAAMKMVGHKTQSIYQRYAIADESMLKDAAEKLEQLHSKDNNNVVGQK